MRFVRSAKNFGSAGAVQLRSADRCLNLGTHPVAAAPPQLPTSGGTGFLGQWCAQGDPTKPCSISANGPFFSITNEQGSTSSGHIQGMNSNVLVAEQWQFVQGTLSGDGSRINWSNGTFWAKCDNGGGGGAAGIVVLIFREPGIATAIIPWGVPSASVAAT